MTASQRRVACGAVEDSQTPGVFVIARLAGINAEFFACEWQAEAN